MRTCAAAFLVLSAGPGILSAQVDANGNGISDIYERHFNSGQLFGPEFTCTGDKDGDGQNNLQESISGTDPLKFDPPEGHLVQTIRHVPATWWQEPGQPEPTLLTPEAFEVGWQAVAGKQYTLSCSPRLEGGSWLPVGDPIYGYFEGLILIGCIPDAGGGQMPDIFFWRVEACDIDQDGDGLNDYEEILFGTDPDTPATFTGIPDMWLTAHYPSAQGFDLEADDDNDGLANTDEYFNGVNPHNVDSDGDGTTDGAEVNQGSNPNDNTDGGSSPFDPLEEVTFAVGGDYASWRMEIQGQGPRDTRLLRFASPASYWPLERTFKLQRNNKYEITLHRIGGVEDWYCWEARVGGKPTERTFDYDPGYYQLGARNPYAKFFGVANHWLVDNRDGLLTPHLHSWYANKATGLKAYLVPIEIQMHNAADGKFEAVNQLRVAKWQNAFSDSGFIPNYLDSWVSAYEPDAFRIRIPMDDLPEEYRRVFVSTTGSTDPAYNDDSTEVSLMPADPIYSQEDSKGYLSKPIILVADQFDNAFKNNNQVDDQTHIARLGGQAVFRLGQDTDEFSTTLPVPVKRKVRVAMKLLWQPTDINPNGPAPATIERFWDSMGVAREIFAQAGIAVEFDHSMHKVTLANVDFSGDGLQLDGEPTPGVLAAEGSALLQMYADPGVSDVVGLFVDAKIRATGGFSEVAGIAIGDKAEMLAHSIYSTAYWHDQVYADFGETFLVSKEGTNATLSHELAHVLSLLHLNEEVDPENRQAKKNLMSYPTNYVQNYVADTKRLAAFQVELMRKSRFTQASE